MWVRKLRWTLVTRGSSLTFVVIRIFVWRNLKDTISYVHICMPNYPRIWYHGYLPSFSQCITIVREKVSTNSLPTSIVRRWNTASAVQLTIGKVSFEVWQNLRFSFIAEAIERKLSYLSANHKKEESEMVEFGNCSKVFEAERRVDNVYR